MPFDPRQLDRRHKIPKYDTALLPAPPPQTEPDEPPFLCLRINRHWVPYMLAALDRLTWQDAYDDVPEMQTIHALRGHQLIALVAAAFDCEGNIVLRQNPANPCQLEQSSDGGLTWTLAFDYALCIPQDPIQTISDVNVAIELYQQALVNIILLNEIYLDDPENIAPDMTYDMGPNDEFRDNAHCAAAFFFTTVVAEALLEARKRIEDENQDIFQTIAEVAGSVAAVVTAFFLGPQAGLWVRGVIIGMTATMLAALTATFILGISEAALTDPIARAQVACCLYNGLKGATVTETAFSNALSGGCVYENENAEDFHNAMLELLGNRDLYLLYLEALQESYSISETGALLPCDCPDWTTTLDFTVDDFDFTIDGAFAGAYVPGVGFVVEGDDASTDGMRIHSAWPSPFDMKTIAAHIDVTCGSSSTVDRTQTLQVQSGAVEVTDDHVTNCPSGDGSITLEIVQDLSISAAYVHTAVGALGSGAQCIIDQMTITGSGAKPAFLP